SGTAGACPAAGFGAMNASATITARNARRVHARSGRAVDDIPRFYLLPSLAQAISATRKDLAQATLPRSGGLLHCESSFAPDVALLTDQPMQRSSVRSFESRAAIRHA